MAETSDPEIKAWLLRDGYKNSVMHEYLAYTCATAGDLRQELRAEEIDQQLFDGAGDIIEALIMGGPAQDMGDYDHAAEVVSRYLHHFPSFPRKLRHFLVLQSIERYLSDGNWDATERTKNGWSAELRDSTLRKVQELYAHEEWPSLVEQGLASADSMVFEEANRSAKALGIDTWDIHWKRLDESPLDSTRWFDVMDHATPERIDQIVARATKVIPLDKIATGPADETGLGPGYELHSCLDWILQDLCGYPGKGKELILAGLRSPVVRNRHMALNALSPWRPEMPDDEIMRSLSQALSEEPNDEVRKRIQMVIDGRKAM